MCNLSQCRLFSLVNLNYLIFSKIFKRFQNDHNHIEIFHVVIAVLFQIGEYIFNT